MSAVMAPRVGGVSKADGMLQQLLDPWWRLNNLYQIVDENGVERRFVPNEEQAKFFHSMGRMNLALKARQVGLTTLLCLMALDQCLFVKNHAAGIIFHTKDDAEKAFRNKIKFAYDRLPEQIKAFCRVTKETTTEMTFGNGSSIGVGVSARSGTVQWLHVSEFAKMCARFPEKAREVVTGSFNAMPKGALLFVESTAEGQGSYFYDYCMEAIRRDGEGRAPSQGEWKLHFFPWWKKPAYSLDDPRIVLNETEMKYFDRLRSQHGIEVSAEQRRWYVTKARVMGEDMKREYPSFPEEAFEAAIVGAIYGNQMAALRGAGRITDVPYDPAVPVNTFWDLGVNDTTAIWLHQRVGPHNQFIGFHQAANEGLAYFVKWMQAKGFIYGTHYLPHDARARMQGERPETREDILRRLLPGQRIDVVRRIDDIGTGIDLTRQALASCWFDQKGCAEGIRMLDSYQYEWDEGRGTFRRTPLHNFASNGADAFRQFAQAFVMNAAAGGKKFKRHRSHWRT
jgi:hypothetical protein